MHMGHEQLAWWVCPEKNKDCSLSCQLPVANKGGVLGAPPRTMVEFVQACSVQRLSAYVCNPQVTSRSQHFTAFPCFLGLKFFLSFSEVL